MSAARDARFLALAAALVGLLACSTSETPPSAEQSEPPCPVPPSGKNYSGQDLTDHNFSRTDLTGANFSRATLNGAQFIGANLAGASFRGAKLGPSAKNHVSFSEAALRQACFIGTTLAQADLQFADVTCADFSQADLTDTKFGPLPKIDTAFATEYNCRTRFVKATMKIDQFPLNLWRYTDFSYANFIDLSPATFSLERKDITGAILEGAKLGGFHLEGATLTDVNLRHADLRGAHLDGATMYGIQLDNARMNSATLRNAKLYDNSTPSKIASLRSVVLQHGVLDGAQTLMSHANLRGANLSGASLRNVVLSNATLEAGEGLNAAQLVGADLSGAQFQAAALNGVSFENTTLLNAVFDGTTMEGTVFTGAMMAGASFRNKSTLSGVTFYNAGLQNVKFNTATLKASGSTSQGVDFACTQLGGADFTNAQVLAASYVAAVAPPASECCKQTDGTYCGDVTINNTAYGATVLPKLTNQVTCPNGDEAACTGEQWLIRNWQTDLCNSAHRMETVWEKPDCDGPAPPGPTVSFKDPKLKKCVQEQLFGPGKDDPVTKEQAKQVTRISCAGRGITDATGLEDFTNLIQLDLTANSITDAAPFQKISALQTLRLEGNRIKTLDLSRMKALIFLDASNNPLTAVTGMVTVYLEYLNLSGGQLIGELDLSFQDELYLADLSQNQLTGIGNVSQLTALSYLYLENNGFKDLPGLKTLACPESGQSSLQHVSLSCNQGMDCAALSLDACSHGRQLLKGSRCGQNNLPGCLSRAAR